MELSLQNEVMALAGVYGAIIGGLLGNALDNLEPEDIDTQEKVTALLAQVAAQAQSSERDALLVALSELLGFYAGAGA